MGKFDKLKFLKFVSSSLIHRRCFKFPNSVDDENCCIVKTRDKKRACSMAVMVVKIRKSSAKSLLSYFCFNIFIFLKEYLLTFDCSKITRSNIIGMCVFLIFLQP